MEPRLNIRYGSPAIQAKKLSVMSGGVKKMSVLKKNTWILLVLGFAVLIAIGVATS